MALSGLPRTIPAGYIRAGRTGWAPPSYATVDVDSVRPQWMEPRAYLLPASSCSRMGFPTARLPEGSEIAAAWGGFIVQKLCNGEHRFTIEQDVDWLRPIPGLTWAALWDLACEPELVSSPDAIRDRQIWTRDRAIEFVEADADETWAWAPTVQGYSLDDYKRSCDDIAPLVDELIEYFTLSDREHLGLGRSAPRFTRCRAAHASRTP